MFEWSIPKSEVNRLNIHYQWWSKAGGGPGYKSQLNQNYIFKIFIGLKIDK